MINRPSKSANPTHYFGAVLKCALLLIFFILGVEVYAQSYNMSESYRIGGTTQSTASSQQWGAYGGTMKSDYRVMGNAEALSTEYKAYQGTVYEPFNDTPPSESESGSSPSKITNRRNGFVDRPDTPPAPGSPVGEPLVLLLFAAVTAAIVAWRQKRRAQV